MDTQATEGLEVRDALQRLKTLEYVLEQRKKRAGIEYYTPNSSQYKAHCSKAEMILFCGGNRSGKSTLGAVELAWHLTKKYPDWFPKERKFYKPIKAVVVATENPIIDKVIYPKIASYLPVNFIQEVRKISGGYVSKIVCKDGSTVDFLTNEQDDMAFESQDWDFYWGDEPQRQRKYQAIMRGLVDRNGIGVITFTPLVEPWMKEELVDKADGKRIEVIIADIRDNLKDIKGNQILTEEAIKRFESDLPEDVRETRIHGSFFHLRGAVYQEFSEVHQVTFEYQYPDPVYVVLDPHDRQPHHVIWAVIDRNDDIFIHTELASRCTVEELASQVKGIEKSLGYKIRRRLIDPNFGRKPLIITGRNMMEELARAGCPGWGEADDPKDEGRLKVKEYLHYDRKKPISFTNKPKLFFHKERVPLTIQSIRNHQYEEWIGKIAGERDPKEKPKDKDTHGADCIRYLCMCNPRWERNTSKQEDEPFY